MILILDEWPESRASRAWTFLKVFLKEGVYLGNWRDVFSYRKPFGSVIAPRGLIRELRRRGYAFRHNERNFGDGEIDTIVALRDARNLRWALEQKRLGRVKRVVAGPVIATLPDEAGAILLDEAIDRILFVGPWHRDLFLRLAPRPLPAARTMFWGIDVDDWLPGETEKRDTILVYKKNPEAPLFRHVIDTLERRGDKFEVLECGRFNHKTYLAALQRARMAVFLSRSETQGLAMFEAWSANVPTLHYNPGVMTFLGRDYPDASSCPYLKSQCGAEFKGEADFAAAWDDFVARRDSFRPRQFVVDGYTSAHAAENFIELVSPAAAERTP